MQAVKSIGLEFSLKLAFGLQPTDLLKGTLASIRVSLIKNFWKQAKDLRPLLTPQEGFTSTGYLAVH